LTKPKSNGEKSQTHHCQTRSKKDADKVKKVEMEPRFLDSNKQELPTHKQKHIPRPKQVLPNPKHNQILNTMVLYITSLMTLHFKRQKKNEQKPETDL
jgi:hypothetical protein